MCAWVGEGKTQPGEPGWTGDIDLERVCVCGCTDPVEDVEFGSEERCIMPQGGRSGTGKMLVAR